MTSNSHGGHLTSNLKSAALITLVYPCVYCLQWPPRPWRPPNDLRNNLTSDLKSATLITLVSICILLPTASEAMVVSKQPRRSFDPRFELSNLDYPGINVNIASNNLQRAPRLWRPQTPLEARSDLKIQLSDLDYICYHASLPSKCLQ